MYIHTYGYIYSHIHIYVYYYTLGHNVKDISYTLSGPKNLKTTVWQMNNKPLQSWIVNYI